MKTRIVLAFVLLTAVEAHASNFGFWVVNALKTVSRNRRAEAAASGR